MNVPFIVHFCLDIDTCFETHLICTNCSILTFNPAVNQETDASGRRYQGITLTGWIWCNCSTHKTQVDIKKLYNRVPQTAWVSWSENQLLRTPVEQPSRMRKKCCYSQRNLGSICYSLFCLQLNSHTQSFHNPFENKVWEVYFSTEVCSFVIIVDYVSACICIRIVVSWLYNTKNLNFMTIFITKCRFSMHKQNCLYWISHEP